MSYIQTEIGGRLRGIKFSQGTNMILQDSPMMDMSQNERIAFGMGYVVWAGLKTNCAIKGERFTKTVDGTEVPATLEDVFSWIETVPEQTLLDIANLYAEVNPPVQQTEDVEKKSLTDTVTEPSVTE